MTGKKRKESNGEIEKLWVVFSCRDMVAVRGEFIEWDPQFTSAYTAFASQTMGIILFDQNQIYIILLLQHGLEHRKRK